MSLVEQELILVLDFGGQYTQLIARRIRDCNVYCEIEPHNVSIDKIKGKNPKGIIFSGGPSSVYVQNAPTVDPAVYELGVPVLGICYGMQLMTHQLRGKVVSAEQHEYGRTNLKVMQCDNIFKNLMADEECWMSHGDRVEEAPPGFQVTARTEKAPVAAMANPEQKLYAVQFHPEVVHTPKGM